MIAIFEKFIVSLSNDVPSYIYYILISLACILIVAFFIAFKWKEAFNHTFKLLCYEYLFLIYCSTVFFRTRVNDIFHNFSPFWSYRSYISGDSPILLPEIIMNVAVFIPFGLLLGAAFQNLKWWKIILMGFLVSVTIEALQYIFKLGVAEFDDVFNNTLGTAIGYSLNFLLHFSFNKLRRNKT